jgi:hypothetical protein
VLPTELAQAGMGKLAAADEAVSVVKETMLAGPDARRAAGTVRGTSPRARPPSAIWREKPARTSPAG